MPILLWPGLFSVFFANGAIYATTARFIDQQARDFSFTGLALFYLTLAQLVGLTLVDWCCGMAGPQGLQLDLAELLVVHWRYRISRGVEHMDVL
jgi:hypothetical protein